MLEKGKGMIIKIGDVIIDKFKELKDQTEIGKCIRTGMVSGTIIGVSYIICKNGGINYNNKLFIGCSKNNI